MERVGQIMDTTECGDIFTTTVKLTLSLIHRYPELVSNHFQVSIGAKNINSRTATLTMMTTMEIISDNNNKRYK